MATMKGKRVLTSLYLDPDMAARLRELSAVTRVPQAVYLREAVELLLAHYKQTSDLIAGKGTHVDPISAHAGADRRSFAPKASQQAEACSSEAQVRGSGKWHQQQFGIGGAGGFAMCRPRSTASASARSSAFGPGSKAKTAAEAYRG